MKKFNGSLIAKHIDIEYNKEKRWKEKKQRENEIKKQKVSSENILILGEHARTTLILEK